MTMKGSERGDDLVDVRVGEFAAIRDFIETRASGELAHAYRIVDGGTLTIKVRVVCCTRDSDDAIVQRRGKSAVEPQFLVAIEAPLLKRAEIQKAEVHRLLEFVGVRTGQHDVGDVRFDVL